MNLLDSVDYRIERWRYQSLLGVRKIIWMYAFLGLLAFFPAYSFGKLAASTTHLSTKAIKINPKITTSPKFRIEPATALSYGNQRGFYAKISNKVDDSVKNIGYFPWVYRYKISDINGVPIAEGTNTSYLLPNADTYVIAPVTNEKGINLAITTDTERSVPVKFDLAQSKLLEIPTVAVTNNPDPTLLSDNPKLMNIRFSVSNTSTYHIRTTDCIFLLRNPDGQVIGIGRYTVPDLKKNEVREVIFTYPTPDLGTTVSIEVIPQVNYLDEENLKLTVE